MYIHGEVEILYWKNWIYVDIKRSVITIKKFLKIMLCIMGSLLAVIVAFWFSISYTVNYKKTTCDTSVSPDGKYELTLQAVGESD